jgi:hypothetical protein
MHYLSGELILLSIGRFLGSSAFYSSKSKTLGMYNNWTSNMTGVLGAATLSLPSATSSPFGNASCHINDDLLISAEPTHCNPHTVMQFPWIFNPTFGKALDVVATHLIYSLQWWNARRLCVGAHEERCRQPPKERHEQYARSRLPVVGLTIAVLKSSPTSVVSL